MPGRAPPLRPDGFGHPGGGGPRDPTPPRTPAADETVADGERGRRRGGDDEALSLSPRHVRVLSRRTEVGNASVLSWRRARRHAGSPVRVRSLPPDRGPRRAAPGDRAPNGQGRLHRPWRHVHKLPRGVPGSFREGLLRRPQRVREPHARGGDGRERGRRVPDDRAHDRDEAGAVRPGRGGAHPLPRHHACGIRRAKRVRRRPAPRQPRAHRAGRAGRHPPGQGGGPQGVLPCDAGTSGFGPRGRTPRPARSSPTRISARTC